MDYQRQRRGAILILVLACLAIAAAMSVVIMGQILAERRAVQLNHRRLQAAWLAEAGVERAAARLAADPKYTGENWKIAAKELASDESASVRIQIGTIAGQPERRSVRVQSDYSDAPERRCRQLKQIIVDRNAILSRQPTKASD
jgi:type II secretory pathway component PulK